jgi:CDGSH iron-sulfur domain-containing protein 3
VISFPAARLSVAPLPTALLWSTAPALRAKLTAATADPVLAMTSAAIEMIVAGCGLEIFMLQTTRRRRLRCGAMDVEIKVRDNGPYKVTGPVRLIDAEGNVFDVAEGPIALCRCGLSETKPFCDRSHRENGFESCPRAAAR